jgi:phage gpG-like protein
MIAVDIAGAHALVERLQSMPERVAARLAITMAGLGADLRGLVQDSIAGSGLHSRSGRLNQSIEVEADETSVSAGIDTAAVPYAAIQEYGGTTRAHVIEAINAAALRFQIGGRTVFAKRVMHPGSVIPAHSFLATALAELAPVARDAVADAAFAEAQA